MLCKFLDAEFEVRKSTENETSIECIKDSLYKNYTHLQSLLLSDAVEPENQRMKTILDLLVYTHRKKIELKLDFFKEFEDVIEQETSQLKAIDTQIAFDKVNNGMKHIESDELDKLKASSTISDD